MSLFRFGTRNTGLILSPTQIASVVLGVDTVPAAFTVGMWTLTPIVGGLRIEITSLPVDGGQPISALQYRLDGGAWATMSGTGTGNRDVTGLSPVEYDVELRAVNSVGNGAAGDLKSATPTGVATTLLGVTPISPSTAADSGDIAVGTIPAGCNACLVAGVYYSGTAGGPTSITGTFASVPAAGGALRIADAAGSLSVYAQALKVSAAGSDTIRIQRGSAYNDGPAVQIVWLQVADPDDFVRDYQVDRRPGGANVGASITITSQTTDLVVAWISRDTGDPGANTPAGTTQVGGYNQNNFATIATFTVNVPGSPSSTVTDPTTGQFWNNAHGFSIK